MSKKPIKKREALSKLGPRVLERARPQAKTLAIGFVALLLASGINLLFPYLIGKILNEELGFELASDLPRITVMLIALFLLQAAFFYVRHYAFLSAGYRIVAQLRKDLYNAIIEQDVAFFDSARVGDLLSRLSSDTQQLQRAVTINLSVSVRYIIQVIGGTALMLFISPKLTVVILVLVPLIVMASIYWGKKLRKFSRKMQDELGIASVVAEESVGGVRTVRVFTGEEYEKARYASEIHQALETSIQRTKVAAFFTSSIVFLIHSGIAIMLWYGGSLVLAGELTIGDLTAFVLYCLIVAISFGFLANVWEEFMQAVGASERIFEIVDQEPQVVAPKNPRPLPEVRAGSISFRNVTFSYPSRSSVAVLQDLTLDIPEGSTVAVVGPSGAGKSTIAALIPRFYDPQQGSITYCDIPLVELDPLQLRREISLVAQEPQVFSISIGENIRYGRVDASDEEVVAAAQVANIHDFIASLPEGYETLVGDRGVTLSGGQRQRVAIARALLKDPKFLILDEATSALDSENEQLVQQALTRLMEDRTSLVIAHRLSTVQHADNVFVMRDGAIVQQGTHGMLVGQEGLYKTLVEHQLL